MIKIGLCGGIGSGKSVVSKYLREQGYPVIDADEIAHEITEPGSEMNARLASAFGVDILGGHGELMRKLLAERAFSTPENKRMLDEITHEEILKRIEDELSELSMAEATGLYYPGFCFIDAPLFFEAGLERYCDLVWLIHADRELRMERASKRDGAKREDIERRDLLQMSEEERIERADLVIDNNGSKEELFEAVRAALSRGDEDIEEFFDVL